jgi:hypothetical protein
MPTSATTATTATIATLVVPSDRNGPPGMANGGWLVGRLAEALGAREVTVTLRAPTPLQTPLDLVRGDDDVVGLYTGDTLLAEADVRVGPASAPPPPIDTGAALLAELRFPGHHEHPFPTCFVCGPARDIGDGLRIFPGRVPGRPGAVASLWTPSPAHADRDGSVPTAVVAGALDCPTGWAHWAPGAVALLGRLTIHHTGSVRAGSDHVVIAERQGAQGRKSFATAGIYDEAGRCVATSVATWISIS